MKKTSTIPGGYVKINSKTLRNRSAIIASVVCLSTGLMACESSHLKDLNNASAPGAQPPAKTVVSGQNSGPTKLDTKPGTPGGTGTQNNIELRGPATEKPSTTETYPSLTVQPNKPKKILSKEEKEREIRELANAGKTHVNQRESGLGKPAKAKKAKEKKLSPPEKLRLARTRSLSPNNASLPTGSRDENIDFSSVPVTTEIPANTPSPPNTRLAKKSPPQKPPAKSTGNPGVRPTVQKPKMVFFSSGARKLTKKQQKPLNEIAGFRDNKGMNVYVLGFAQVVPKGNNEANIESQNLAISRANHVANGLRKRGFAFDQVVVQIIDEIQDKGVKSNATLRRVDVYFESDQTTENAIKTPTEHGQNNLTGGFLSSQPFELPESDR